MDTVTVSPKYQVVIPKAAREQLDIKPGQKVHVLVVGGALEFIPQRSITSMRGAFPGLDTTVERDEDRL